jgi:hypothetical protein
MSNNSNLLNAESQLNLVRLKIAKITPIIPKLEKQFEIDIANGETTEDERDKRLSEVNAILGAYIAQERRLSAFVESKKPSSSGGKAKKTKAKPKAKKPLKNKKK